MGHHTRSESSPACSIPEHDLSWPFGRIDGLDRDDIRQTSYEIFFTSCRSSPGFGGRHPLVYYSSDVSDMSRLDPNINNGVGMVTVSRVKRALGLKTLRKPSSRRTVSVGGGSPRFQLGSQSPGFSSPSSSPRTRRPMTSAEIMRQQMRVTEQSDNRLRKTLMRTLVGQMGRRAETIILPLELLRHLKPSEFNDSKDYYVWQRRQLKILEAGLLLHPLVPLDPNNTFAGRLREIVRSSDTRAVDLGKNSETMRTLCNCVVSLSWRTEDPSPPEFCHWADGAPLNLHLYLSLLSSIFEDTLVLDEVDELLELIKKTWSTLRITRPMHNACLMWALFHQYVATGQIEPDLLCASLALMAEVSADAKKGREPGHTRVMGSILGSIRRWSEKKLLDYHNAFTKGTVGSMENLLPLALSAVKILEEDLSGNGEESGAEPSGNRVDHYIRSSMKNAFNKLLEFGKAINKRVNVEEDATKMLVEMAREAEELAVKEKEWFSPVLKKWHPIAAGVAAVTLHNCYGNVLKHYLARVSTLTNDIITVLQRAGQLEKVLVQMVVEDSVECEDGGKAIVREMVPFEVDSIILNLLKIWMEERFKAGKDCLQRAKETETWNPKSKTEPYAQSAVDLFKIVQQIVGDFFEIPVGISEDVVQDLADSLESLFRDYTTFVASCGSKQNYLPPLPPLTRCNRDSKFVKLWKKATPCSASETLHGQTATRQALPSTSRGTQRLYIRLNTLHYLLTHIHSLDKTISLSPRVSPSARSRFSNGRRRVGSASSYFELATSSAHAAYAHVSEVAAYRLVFLDSSAVMYDGLYVGDVASSRVHPALRMLKQNMTLMCAMVTDQAQAFAVRELMKATFEAYLMVLLAGGTSRVFYRSDHEMIEEDFESLKRVFCSCGDGLISEDVVERESDTVEGVVGLMGQCTEQLMEDFSIVACEASGMGMGVVSGTHQRIPMPPTTGKWNRSDPNTVLRVLCYRNDQVANLFLKRTFELAKRR